MLWYSGSVAEAISVSKKRQAVFVVYIEGKDEDSQKMSAALNAPEVSEKLSSNNFVAVKLLSGSESHLQFSQIYKETPVPSLYFIGKTGVPADIIINTASSKDISQRIDSVLQKCGNSPPQSDTERLATQQAAVEEKDSVGKIAEKKSTEDKPTEGKPSGEQMPSGAAVGAVASTSSADDAKGLSIEEKIEHAKTLVEKQRQIKDEEEKENERRKEVERRKMGQEAQKMRRWQQDQELKQLQEERQREKQEAMQARQKILDQIAQDKAERAAKFGQTSGKPSEASRAPPQAQAQPQISLSNSSVARLQFRLPQGGAPHTHNFEADATLQEVRNYVAGNINLPFRDFILSTTFPRREFTDSDSSQTLRDLQLVPNAAILIIQGSVGANSSRRGTVAPSGSGGFVAMVWSLLAPILNALRNIKNWLLPRGGRPGAGGQQQQPQPQERTKRSADSPDQPPEQSARKRRNPDSMNVRKQGNVHRLTDNRDSDDENNTWNGNSTQQM